MTTLMSSMFLTQKREGYTPLVWDDTGTLGGGQ